MEAAVKEEPKDLEDWPVDEQDTSFNNFVKVEMNEEATAFSYENEHQIKSNYGSSNGKRRARPQLTSSVSVKEESSSETEEDEESTKNFTHQQNESFVTNPECVYWSKVSKKKRAIQTFKCDLCDIRRNRNGSLETHMKNVHEDNKMQQCHLCDYSTKSMIELRDHVDKIHSYVPRYRQGPSLSQLKTYDCEYCDFTSKWKSTLNRHINNIHKRLEKLNCHMCGYKTTDARNLQAHVQNVHFWMKTMQKKFLSNNIVLIRYHLDNVHDLPTSHWCCLCDHTYCEYE